MVSKTKREKDATLDVLIHDFMYLLSCEALFLSTKYVEIACRLHVKARSFGPATVISVCTHPTTKESCNEVIYGRQRVSATLEWVQCGHKMIRCVFSFAMTSTNITIISHLDHNTTLFLSTSWGLLLLCCERGISVSWLLTFSLWWCHELALKIHGLPHWQSITAHMLGNARMRFLLFTKQHIPQWSWSYIKP